VKTIMHTYRKLILMSGILGALLWAGLATAQNSAGFRMEKAVIDGGSGQMSAASFVVQGTLGQTEAGSATLASSNFRVQGGFWPQATPEPSPTETPVPTPTTTLEMPQPTTETPESTPATGTPTSGTPPSETPTPTATIGTPEPTPTTEAEEEFELPDLFVPVTQNE
jgi:hypothetical protein